MRKVLLFSLCLASLMLACQSRPPGGSGSEIEWGKSQEEDLQTALKLWKKNASEHYSVDISSSCECVMMEFGVMRVEVKNGEVLRLTDLDDGSTPMSPDDASKTLLEDFPSAYGAVEAYFEEIRTALQSAEKLTVEYDHQYGYPTRISIIWDSEVMDASVSHSLGNLKPL